MANNILLIAVREDAEIEVRWGEREQTEAAFADTLRLDNTTETGQTLSRMAHQSRVIVMIPSRHVVLRECTFHGKSRQATAQNLAYSQENTLLGDIEQLHWVILGKNQQHYGIAGVEKNYLRSVLEQLAACGIQPDSVVPDVLLLPLSEAGSMASYDHHCWIRTGEWQGQQFPEEWYNDTLLSHHTPLSGESSSELTNVNQLTDDLLWYLAAEAASTPFNLLQDGRKAAAFLAWLRKNSAACALLVAAASLTMWGLNYQQTTRFAGQQMAAWYQHYSPGEPLPQNLLATTDRKIRLAQQSLNESQFFRMLPQAMETLALAGTPQVHSLQFDATRKQLSLTLQNNNIVLPGTLPHDDVSVALHPGTQSHQTIMTIEELP